jgi:hypothetical protein
MSSVFNGYKVNKKNFWTVVDYIKRNVPNYPIQYSVYEQHKDIILKERLKEIQVFDYSNSIYIFRILESGFETIKILRNIPVCQNVFVDTRSDSEKSIKKSFMKILDFVDDQIRMKRYFIVPIISKEDLIIRRD